MINNENLERFKTFTNIIPTDNVSKKYSVISTENLTKMIVEKTGFNVATYQEHGTRKAENVGKTKHLIRFRAPQAALDGVVPEIVMLNSYNKGSAFKLYVGFFRIACLNGLIAGDTINGFSQAHYNFNYDNLLGFLDSLPGTIEKGIDQVLTMKKTPSGQWVYDMAKEALEISRPSFLENTSEELVKRTLVHMVERPRRMEDRGTDAFTAYNRVQERIIRGLPGVFRKISSPSVQVKVNRFMWDKVYKACC